MKGFDQADRIWAVQHATHHDRARAEVVGIGERRVFGHDAGIDARTAPGDLQPRHVALVDLVER
jgi:hypothetical protein